MEFIKIIIMAIIIGLAIYFAIFRKDDDDDNSNTGNWNFSL